MLTTLETFIAFPTIETGSIIHGRLGVNIHQTRFDLDLALHSTAILEVQKVTRTILAHRGLTNLNVEIRTFDIKGFAGAVDHLTLS